MDAKSASEIVRALADGVDPETGEVLPTDSCLQQPQTVRALHIVLRALEKFMDREKRQERLPTDAGLAWSQEEDDLLSTMFDSGATVQQTAASHERTTGAIQSRLMRLGKIEAPQY